MADLRKERSKDLLRGALLALLEEKPFNKVSVYEVAERAGLSKKAFYNHYRDINNLLIDCYQHALGKSYLVHKPLGSYDSRRDFVLTMLANVMRLLAFTREHSRLAQVYLDQIEVSPYFAGGRDLEIEGTLRYLAEVQAGTEIPALKAHGPVDPTIAAGFLSAGCNGIFRTWLKGGMREPEKSVAASYVMLVLHSASALSGTGVNHDDVAVVKGWLATCKEAPAGTPPQANPAAHQRPVVAQNGRIA